MQLPGVDFFNLLYLTRTTRILSALFPEVEHKPARVAFAFLEHMVLYAAVGYILYRVADGNILLSAFIFIVAGILGLPLEVFLMHKGWFLWHHLRGLPLSFLWKITAIAFLHSSFYFCFGIILAAAAYYKS